MNQVSYRPAASPVDTFAPVGVSGTTDVRVGPDPLAQLGAALGRFSDSVAQAADGYTDRQKQAAGPEAARIQAENQFKNMDALREAVKSGKLNLTDNPWTKVHLEQLVAGEQTSGFLHELENTLNTDNSPEVSGVRNARNPKVLSDWIDSKVGKYLSSQSHWGIAPATAAATQWKEGFIQRQIGEWSRQQDMETKRSFISNLSMALGPVAQSFSQDPNLGTQLIKSGGLGQVQNLIDSHIRITGDEEAAGKMALSALHEVASAAHNPDLVQAAADSLKVGKKSLSSWATSEQIKNLQDSVNNQIIDDDQRKRSLEKLGSSDVWKGMASGMADSIAKTGSCLEFIKASNIQLDQLSPEQRSRVESMRNPPLGRQVIAEVQSSIKQFGAGSPQTTSLIEAFVANHAPDADTAFRLWNSLNATTEQRPAASDLTVLMGVENIINDPEQTPENKLWAITEADANRHLSMEDLNRVHSNLIVQSRPVPVTDNDILPKLEDTASKVIEWKMANDPKIKSEYDGIAVMVGADAASAYKHGLMQEITRGIKDQWNRFQNSKHGQVTFGDFDKIADSFVPPEMKAEGQAKQGSPNPLNSEEAHQFRVDPLGSVKSGAVKWNNGFEMDGHFLQAPSMFRDASDVRHNFDTTLKSLGIADPRQVLLFIREQMKVNGNRRDIVDALGHAAAKYVAAKPPAGNPTSGSVTFDPKTQKFTNTLEYTGYAPQAPIGN